MRIIGISGSLRPGSSNESILGLCHRMFDKSVEFDIYNGIADLPHFNPALDTDDPPPAVALFRKALKESDGILICTPEYAFGIPGALKNALDWTVSSDDFGEKPVALITASTSGKYAHAAVLQTLTALHATIPASSALLISFIRAKMNAQGEITDTATLESIASVVLSLYLTIKEKIQTN
jgi:chromate reductase, NAD(P)H dehydrogenase (quinone)